MIGERWGVTQAEVERRYPCDDLMPANGMQLWRGVTVAAPATSVWPWLCPAAAGAVLVRLAGQPGAPVTPRAPGTARPAARRMFLLHWGRFGVGRVLSVLPGQHLTARVMGAVMSYVLSPEGSSTRLLLKIVVDRSPWYAASLALGDWPMARRQLKNLKQLAEAERISRAP